MSLLHSLLHDYHNTYRKLTCVHVNHGLRHQSVEEEQFLKDYCRAHHIELYVKHLDLSQIVERVIVFSMKQGNAGMIGLVKSFKNRC